MTRQHDPITVEIIRSSLQAVALEMFATMRRTAFTPLIYEVLDFGVAVTDAKGDLLVPGAGIPGFVGMLEPGVKAMLAKHAGNIEPGDLFITNNAFVGGASHANDMGVYLPVFAGEEMVAWVANKAHWSDVGGMAAGSVSGQAVEMYQEGLWIPEVKLFESGRLNQGILDILCANSRLPESATGDLWAAIATLRDGEAEILQLVEKYGLDCFRYATDHLLRTGEELSLAALRRLPKGEFTATDTLDDGREIRLRIAITDDEFVVDLRGNPKQSPSAANSPFASTLSLVQIIFKCMTSPDEPANAGNFRPLRLLCDPGSVFAAEAPAAVGFYYAPAMAAMELFWKALATNIPGVLPAGSFASVNGTFLQGVRAGSGEPFSLVEPEPGGWGASPTHDGPSAQFCGAHGDTFNCPVEISEARYGVHVDQFALNTAPGGEGKYCGGRGIVLDYRITGPAATLTALYSRNQSKPWALEHGRDGSNNEIVVRFRDGREARMGMADAIPLVKDDVVRIITASGAGYGDPAQRCREQVADDLRNGYITAEQAEGLFALEPVS